MPSEPRAAGAAVPNWSFAAARWSRLAFPQDSRLLITGGTGFFGKSLLAAVAHLDAVVAPREIAVLSRSPEAFAQRYPELARLPGVVLVRGNVRDLVGSEARYTHIVHAAVDRSLRRAAEPLIEDIEVGMNAVLALAERCGARLLFTSSGASYGAGEPGRPMAESDADPLAPPPDGLTPYAAGKRRAELLCAQRQRSGRADAVIARCFAFVGEYLGIESQHAAADLLCQALTAERIVVSGSGRAIRSYLHAADLAHWLLALLLRGESGRAYNVGSDRPFTILELAQIIAQVVSPHKSVEVAGGADAGLASDWYVPSIERARTELGLEVTVSLPEAIAMSAAWMRREAGLGTGIPIA